MEFFKNSSEELKIDEKKNIPETLKFLKQYNVDSISGTVGELINPTTEKKYVYKICKYFENILKHEWLIMKSLNTLRDFCPHYCIGVSHYEAYFNDNFRKTTNPFEIDKNRKQVKKDVLLIEHVEGKMFGKLLRHGLKKFHSFSLTKQVLCASLISEKHTSLTHYDLHTDNIMIKKCPLNSVFLYTINGKKYLIPTYGYYPVIIDFGCSFNNEIINKPMNFSLTSSHFGFTTQIHDETQDFKKFLCNISHRLCKYFTSESIEKFRDYVEDLYDKKDIDNESGWETIAEESLTVLLEDKVYRIFEKHESDFFEDQSRAVIETLQNLAEIPFITNCDEPITDILRSIVIEFKKIEDSVRQHYYLLYILQASVNSANKNKKLYLTKGKRDDAVSLFKSDVLQSIDDVAKFANIKGVNWDKYLCSLLCLGRCIGKFFGLKTKLLIEQKEKLKPSKTSEEIYSDLDKLLETPFIYDNETAVFVWDSDNKTSKVIVNLKNIENLNNKSTKNEEKIKIILEN